MAITLDGTNGITTETGTGDVSVGDDLIFTGTGNRITGDMSNATIANRVTFQTSTTNGNTVVGAIPNGTSVTCVFRGFNSSDPANASQATFGLNNSSVFIASELQGTGSYLPVTISTGGSERIRVDTSGNLLVGKTTSSTTTQGNAIGPVLANFIASTASPSDGPQIQIGNIAASVANGYRFISFRVNAGGTEVGSITTNGTSSTAYGTSSDYRLKENIAPMTGALAKVAALKPCTYTWKSNGSAGEGFIAHELQAVVPDAVIGEKDAVNEDGSIKPQNIDTSFLVATLTAAIQELSAKNDALEARIAALEGAQA